MTLLLTISPDTMATVAAPASDVVIRTALQCGGPVLLVDDRVPEGRGYLVALAECITADTVNLFASVGGSVVTLAITPAKALLLGLSLQPRRGAAPDMPLYTVSVEAAEGVTTGISAADRAHTLRVAAARDCDRTRLVTPGHIFPVVGSDIFDPARMNFASAAIALLRRYTGDEVAACSQVLGAGGKPLGFRELALFAAERAMPVTYMSSFDSGPI